MEEKLKIKFDQHQLDAVLNLPDFPAKMPICILVPGFTGDMNQKGRFEELSDQLEKQNCISIRFNPIGRGPNSDSKLFRISLVVKAVENIINYFENLDKVDDEKIIIIARGQGAYSTLEAVKNKNILASIFWGAILYPKTSRERQGDYHSYRENGYAELKISEKEKYMMTKEYFEELERISNPKDLINKNQKYCFIHSKKDDIAPYGYIEKFCETAENFGADVKLIELENVSGHMHQISEYKQDYIHLTISWLLDNCLLTHGLNSIVQEISPMFYRIVDSAKESIEIKAQNPLVGGLRRIKSPEFKKYFEPENILIRKCTKDLNVRLIIADENSRREYFKNSNSMAGNKIEKLTLSLIQDLKKVGAEIKEVPSICFPELCFMIIDKKLVYLFWYGFKEGKAVGYSMLHDNSAAVNYFSKMFTVLWYF